MMEDWEDQDYFWRFRRPTKPVKGGIKAQTKKFGQLWWAQKWLEAVEKFGPRRRVARGRSYARKGQVMNLQIEPGLITAAVQGSRDEPYEIDMPFYQVPDSIKQKLQSVPIFTASLLGGELPPEMETLFNEFGVSLFPTKEESQMSDCSCPDVSNPCKHIAALYYLISLELERDPFVLLFLRGISRPEATARKQKMFPDTEPLPSTPQQFWKSPKVKTIALGETHSSDRSQPAILRRIGPFPFWRGEMDLMKTLEAIYTSAREFVKQPKI